MFVLYCISRTKSVWSGERSFPHTTATITKTSMHDRFIIHVNWFLLVLASWSTQPTNGYTYHIGNCPRVLPEIGFNMDKFLGNWYVMQKIDSSSSCWTYNFSNKNNQSKVYQTRNQIVDVEDPEESKSYAGNLEVPDPNNPGVMTVRYPDNVAGKSQFVVYATDYTNYGAVFVCQRILFGHRLSASILSRQPYLDIYSTAKAREKLKGYGIDIRDFQKIDHKGCKYVPPQKRNANSSNVMKWMDF